MGLPGGLRQVEQRSGVGGTNHITVDSQRLEAENRRPL